MIIPNFRLLYLATFLNYFDTPSKDLSNGRIFYRNNKTNQKIIFGVSEMDKVKNPKELKKIAKGALALVLAGSFAFAGTNAFAAENEQTTNQTAAQQTTAPTTDPSSVSTEQQETPSLLPGDFFYFAKTLFEKIQLALTFDDTKEAKLLASQASERIAEAQALCESGNQEKALDTLKSALENVGSAEKIVADTEEEQAKDSTETTTETNVDSKELDSEELKDVKDDLAKSIEALKAALTKGHKSDAAKAAIQKNIAKLSARLTSGNTESTDTNQTTPATDNTNDTATETNTNDTATDTPAADTTATDTTTSDTTNTTDETTVTAPTAEPAPATTTVAPASTETVTPTNHGKAVSEVAKQKPTTGQNHGAAVSEIAKKQNSNVQEKSEKGKK
jgi:hypothetical protein